MFTPQNLAKLNETMTLHQINELVKEQEVVKSNEKASHRFKKNLKRARIEAKKAQRRSKH